jgi:hypothetical protein
MIYSMARPEGKLRLAFLMTTHHPTIISCSAVSTDCWMIIGAGKNPFKQSSALRTELMKRGEPYHLPERQQNFR